MSSKGEVEQIKARVNLVEIIGGYVTLKKYGGIYRGLCPFHSEKSPSFTVSPDRGIFHCFGCGEGGDVFSFLQKIEGWNFVEALDHLSQITGVKLEKRRIVKPELADERERLLLASEFATRYWQSQLQLENNQANNPGKAYLETRHLTLDTIKKFRLGYASDAWDGLVLAAKAAGIPLPDLLKIGVIFQSQKNQNFYDRFRSRLMIPLLDSRGVPIACTGRYIGEAETTEGKYVNSPEQPLFHKGNYLFAVAEAKQAIRKQDLAIVVEGNFDVISAHQAGTENVVGVSGTACTLEQLQMLGRYTKRLALCFDRDAAGITASLKTAQLAWSLGFEVLVITWPDSWGKDPDEVIQKNPEHWLKSVAQPKPFFEYALTLFQEKFPPLTAAGKEAFVSAALTLLMAIPSKVLQDQYINLIAEIAKISRQLINRELNLKLNLRTNTKTNIHTNQNSITNNHRFSPKPAEDKTSNDQVQGLQTAADQNWLNFFAAIFSSAKTYDQTISRLLALPEAWSEILPPKWLELYDFLRLRYSADNSHWQPEGWLQSLDDNPDSKFFLSSEARFAFERSWLASQVRLANPSEAADHSAWLQPLIRVERQFFTRKLAQARLNLQTAESQRDQILSRQILEDIVRWQKKLQDIS